MEISNARFVLAVHDLKRSTHYYNAVLGLAIDFEVPGWTFLSRGHFRIMLGECVNAMAPANLGDHSYFGYLTVQNINQLYTEYTKAGVNFIQPLADKPWGLREFGIRTIDGHRIMFGQEL